MESTDARKNALEHWLSAVRLGDYSLQALPHDASFRRYFRVQMAGQSWIAMDAPPPQENCQPYVVIARTLRDLGLSAPAIVAEDISQGFLLLTDFGDATYLKTLTTQNADQLYGYALDALSILQACREVPGAAILTFDQAWMWREWEWHKEWFLIKLLGLPLTTVERELDDHYRLLIQAIAEQPRVFVHRDYHSGNLMVLPDMVGILDFQDAFFGPITYDVVSLLRDCYIDWPEHHVNTWALSYRQRLMDAGALPASVDAATFLRWFDWMGVQRHLKALMTFARKHVRDHQSHYLQHIPRTLRYLRAVTSRYPELACLHTFLTSQVEPVFAKGEYSCAP